MHIPNIRHHSSVHVFKNIYGLSGPFTFPVDINTSSCKEGRGGRGNRETDEVLVKRDGVTERNSFPMLSQDIAW